MIKKKGGNGITTDWRVSKNAITVYETEHVHMVHVRNLIFFIGCYCEATLPSSLPLTRQKFLFSLVTTRILTMMVIIVIVVEKIKKEEQNTDEQ